MKNRVNRLATLVVATLLAGCGYQLKGQFQFSPELSPMVWQEDLDAEELYHAMRNTFALYGLVLGTQPADTLLRVHDIDTTEVNLSDATVMGMEVIWSVVNEYGVSIISYRSTRVETRLSLSPEVDEEEAREERFSYLRNRVALRVLDQLEALSEEELLRQPDDEETVDE